MLHYWISSRIWVGGGLGYGQNEIQVGNFSEWGPTKFAFAVPAGVEVWQRRRFALALRVRYGLTLTDPESTTHIERWQVSPGINSVNRASQATRSRTGRK